MDACRRRKKVAPADNSGNRKGNETASQDSWTSNDIDSKPTFAKQPVFKRQTTDFKIRVHIKKKSADLVFYLEHLFHYTPCDL